MTTKIQKQFFEKYNVPKRFYTVVNLGDLDNNYQEVSADTLEELFDNYGRDNIEWDDEPIDDIKNFKDYKEKYPKITDSIYLKLIKIIVKKFSDFEIDSICYNHHKEYRVCTDFEWETYNINGDYQKSEEDAILSLFIKLPNIFKSQVQNLFKY